MKKIMLDAGHYGKRNRSPAFPQYYESDMSWKLCNFLAKELESYGFLVEKTRDDKETDIDVFYRGLKARGCDMFISIHSNAVGSEINENIDHPIVYRLNDDLYSNEFAQTIADSIAEIMSTKEKGRVGTRVQENGTEYYGVLRGSKAAGCPHAFIIEHSFHTATIPATWLYDETNLYMLAVEEAKIIANYFNYEKKEIDMTREETISLIKEEFEKREKIYHYWTSLPSWAFKPLRAMYDAKLFSGNSPEDLGLNQTKMEVLCIVAKSLKKAGIIDYEE